MRGEVTVVRPLADFLDRVGRDRLRDLELHNGAEQAPRGANGVEEHCQQRRVEACLYSRYCWAKKGRAVEPRYACDVYVRTV